MRYLERTVRQTPTDQNLAEVALKRCFGAVKPWEKKKKHDCAKVFFKGAMKIIYNFI